MGQKEEPGHEHGTVVTHGGLLYLQVYMYGSNGKPRPRAAAMEQKNRRPHQSPLPISICGRN